VRLGVSTGLVGGPSLEVINRLTIEVQSAHLRAADPSVEGDDDERAMRARVVRAAFGAA